MNEKRYKEDLRNILKQEYGFSERGSADALNKFFGLIVKALEEDRYVKIKGLGIFKLIDVESRKSVDVNTGKSIEIPEHRKISFSVDSALKELINKPFSHFEVVELKDEKFVVEVVEDDCAQQDKDNINMDNQEPSIITTEEVKSSDEGKMLDTLLKEEQEEAHDAPPMVEVEDTHDAPLEDVSLNMSSIEEAKVSPDSSLVEETKESLEAPLVEEVEESHDKPLKKEVEAIKSKLPDEQVTLGEAIRLRTDSRREEWRRLEREMEKEEKSNRIALLVISIFMFLLMMAGLLFVLAPEFLEKLFY